MDEMNSITVAATDKLEFISIKYLAQDTELTVVNQNLKHRLHSL